MKLLFEVIIVLVILGIALILFNPTHLLMPDSVSTLLMLGLVVSFLVFLGIVWKEQARDERDTYHIQKSGRVAFFVGTTILVIGVIAQATKHDIDPWLLLALSGMVLTKLGSRIYHNFKN
jgi:hypothetical protein